MPEVLDYCDLGIREYAQAMKIQEHLVEKRKCGHIHDTLLLVEHHPVYTLGRHASETNILAPPDQLREWRIPVIRTTRGGQVTYHGPGQLVGYPILDLAAMRRGIEWYVGSLETVVIRTLAEFGIHGGRDPRNRGVWVAGKKIAAIGVRVTRGITMHGFALNVCMDLTPYDGIIPCGIPGAGVTSLHLLAEGVNMTAVKETVVRQFRAVFGYSEVTLVRHLTCTQDCVAEERSE